MILTYFNLLNHNRFTGLNQENVHTCLGVSFHNAYTSLVVSCPYIYMHEREITGLVDMKYLNRCTPFLGVSQCVVHLIIYSHKNLSGT